MEETPVPEKLLFDGFDEDVGISLNVTSTHAQILGSVLFVIAVGDFAATAFLLTITYVTTAMDGMKLCEKLLVYNVLVPDLVLEVILFFYIGPATLANTWDPAKADTVWTGFIHTFCIFHPNVAVATICHVIALSMTDAYRYEMANDMKHMSVVVLSTVSLTICFCSLPATEDFGYTVLENWMGPSFNINYQYGSKFMVAAILGLVCFAEFASFLRVMEARKFFQEHKARVNAKTLQDLDQDLVFCVAALVSVCLLFPLIIGIPDPLLMFFPRLIMYLCPLGRVASLLTTCPHFQFAFFSSSEDVDDFAVLEGLEAEQAGKAEEDVEMEQRIEERMAEADAALQEDAARRNSTEL